MRMSKTECKYCRELNSERAAVRIDTVRITGGYYKWECEIVHCPHCGKLLKKYEEVNT